MNAKGKIKKPLSFFIKHQGLFIILQGEFMGSPTSHLSVFWQG